MIKGSPLLTIRLGGYRGVGRAGRTMGVSGLRLASQRRLWVQRRHPSPLSALPKGAGAVQTSGCVVRGARYRGRVGASLGLTEVTVWSALDIPRSVSGMTQPLAVQPADALRALPGAGWRDRVVSYVFYFGGWERSTGGLGNRPRPLVCSLGEEQLAEPPSGPSSGLRDPRPRGLHDPAQWDQRSISYEVLAR